MKIKYPRTFHLPWSPGATSDDKMLKSIEHFIGKEVVITEKMDGENCLDRNTQIITEHGVKSISEICESQYNGMVLSLNHNNNELEFKSIIGHKINISDDWYEITTNSGDILIVTGEHLVYLPKLSTYRKVKNLSIEDEFLII